jgi:hypothetical protein
MRLERVTKLYKKLKNYLFWNSTLRFIMEGYISVSLFSLKIAKEGFDWHEKINIA